MKNEPMKKDEAAQATTSERKKLKLKVQVRTVTTTSNDAQGSWATNCPVHY